MIGILIPPAERGKDSEAADKVPVAVCERFQRRCEKYIVEFRDSRARFRASSPRTGMEMGRRQYPNP